MNLTTIRPLLHGAFLLLFTCVFTTMAWAAPGDLDATFNATGKKIEDLGGFDHANAVAVQSDGKIIVVGDSNGSFAVARFNNNGTLDGTFNPGGSVPGTVLTDFAGSFSQAFAVALQQDGKVVVAGVAGSDFGLARFETNGDLDMGFGTDGKLTINFGRDLEEAKGVALQSDGKIVVVGYSMTMADATTSDFAIARCSGSGVLDTSFSTDGKHLTDFAGDQDIGSGVVIQSDGKIVVGGTTQESFEGKFAAARYTTSGGADTSFSGDGKFVGVSGTCNALVMQSTNIVLAGFTFGLGQDLALVRLTSAGVADGTFSGDGIAQVDLGGEEVINALAIDENGKFVVAGRSGFFGAEDFFVARIKGDGTLDTGFSSDGFDIEDFGGFDDSAWAIAIRPSDDSIVVAGYTSDEFYSNFDFAMARYEGGEPPPAPEIAVFSGISTSAEEVLESGDSVSVPSAHVGLTSATATCTISNQGNANLNDLAVSIAGASDFTVTQPVLTTLTPSQSTTFTIKFKPTTGGFHAAEVNIASNDANEDPFVLNVAATVPSAASDSFAGRVNLGSAATVNVLSDNIGASTETGENTFDDSIQATVWYEWTAPSSGWVAINTAGSEVDTIIGLYTGSTLPGLSLMGHNDESNNPTDNVNTPQGFGASRLTFFANAGISYKIVVGAWGNDELEPSETGSLQLHIAPAAPTVRVTSISSATVDVTAAGDSADVDVGIESDSPLTSFFSNLDYSYPDLDNYRSSGQSFTEAALHSGTNTDGVYRINVPVSQYTQPGTWQFSVWIDSASWSPEGNDLLADNFLIPGTHGPLTVVNSGAVDSAAPVLVGVTGVPASVNVTDADAQFTMHVTVSELLSGVRSGNIYASSGGTSIWLGTIDGTTPSTPSGANTIYHVDVTIPEGLAPSSYFVSFDFGDNALNHVSYSDDPGQAEQPVPPTSSQLKLTVINSSPGLPDILVEQPANNPLVDNVGSVAFGTLDRGASRSRTFVVKNSGDGHLSGLVISKAGAHPGDYTVDGPYLTTLDHFSQTEFTVTFRPTGPGSRNAVIRVASNDTDENPFDINVTGSAISGPEIVVEHPANTGLSAGLSTVAYGNVPTNTPITKTLTLRNLGDAAMSISSATVMGANASEFSITTSPSASVAISGTTTVAIQFAPVTFGAKTAFLRIVSNDANETPFDVALTGSGTPSPGSFVFGAPLFTVNEGSSATITINRIGGSFGEAKVRIATAIGSAIAPGDFAAISPSQEVTFNNGETTKDVYIPTVGNTTPVEPNETFTVTLSSPTNFATLGSPSSVPVRIIDSTADTTAPAVAITAPLLNANILETAGPSVQVTGTATDNKGVADVKIKLNGGSFVSATILAANIHNPSVGYTATVTPVPGTNTIQVQSTDTTGTPSAIVSRTFTYVAMRNLQAQALPAGAGTLTAGFAGTSSRQIGKTYVVTATPAAGRVFDGWTVSGGPTLAEIGVTPLALEKPSLTFVFCEGLQLTANFINNPFPTATSTYHGLVTASTTAPLPGGTVSSNSTEGFIKITVQPTGAFSATLTIDGLVLSSAGVFDNTGNARFGTNRATTMGVARPGKPSLTLDLFLDLTPSPLGTDKVTGTVTQNYRSVITAVSDVNAFKAAFNGTSSIVPGAYLGAASATATYTSVISTQAAANQPPALVASDYPHGFGYSTITVSKAGVVTFIGTLSDGTTPVTISSALSKDLECPLFAQLYGKLGFFGGLVKLDASNPESDMASDPVKPFLWARPFLDVQHHPYGWPEVLKVDVEAAKYVVTTSQSVLRSPDGTILPDDGDTLADTLPSVDGDGNAQIVISGPFMTPNVAKDLNISTADLVAKILPDANFTLSIVRSSGQIAGSFLRPDDGTKPSFKGIIYQKGSSPGGYGYFLTTTPLVKTYDGQGGAVILSAKP